MLFLEEFWNGNISPGEERYHSRKEYSRLLNAMEECEDYLKAKLSQEDFAVFVKYQDADREFGCLEVGDNFMDGFRMGAKVILDVLLSQKPQSA